MPRPSKYEIDADVKKALTDLNSLGTKFHELEMKIGAMTKTAQSGSKKMEDSFSGLNKSIVNAAKGFGAMIAANVSVDGLVQAYVKWDETLKSISQTQAKLAAQQKAFAAEEAAGKTPEQLRASLRNVGEIGKSRGFGPGEAAQMFDTAGDITGGNPDLRRRAAIQMMNLRNAGIDAGTADELMSQFIGYGKTPEQASALALKGAQLTDLSPSAVSKIGAAGDAFGGKPEDALAVAAALRRGGGVTPRQIASMTESVGTGLNESKAADKLRRMYSNYDTMSVDEKLRTMATLGTDKKSLMKRGLSDSEAEAVAKAIPQQGLVASNLRDFRNLPDNLAESQVAAIQAEPTIAEEFAQRQRAAGSEYNALYGPSAGRVMSNAERRRQLGERLQQGEYTGPMFTDQATGEVTRTGRVFNFLDPRDDAYTRRLKESTGASDPDNTKATQKNTDALERLRQAIESKGTTPKDRNAGL